MTNKYKNQIIKLIDELLDDLKNIQIETQSTLNTNLGWSRLSRWKERAIKTISDNISVQEGEKLSKKRKMTFRMNDSIGNFNDESDIYSSHLIALREDIENNPEFILGSKRVSSKEKIPVISPLQTVEKICNKFHIVARQLRCRHDNRNTIEIEDEYDVQDLLHALLKVEFDDIRPEEWTESNAGKSSRMDFLLKKEKVVIEVKKTRKGLSDKEIGDELIIDIERYKEHRDCKILICFVYDPEGRIGNPAGLINDLEKKGSKNLGVRVIIEPKN